MKFLTKKLGFLPRWAWIAGAGGGFYLYRYHNQNGYWPWQANQAAAAGAQQNQNPDLMYQPGGSLPFDSSGGIGGGGTSAPDDFGSLLSLLEGIINRKPAGGGAKKPGSKKHPRKGKTKPQHAGAGPHNDTWSGSAKPGNKQTATGRGRDNTTIVHNNGGREVANTGGKETLGKTRGKNAPAPKSKLRNRPGRPIVSERVTETQHPVSSHPSRNQSVRPNHPPPRPSAPARRSHRTARGR